MEILNIQNLAKKAKKFDKKEKVVSVEDAVKYAKNVATAAVAQYIAQYE